MIEADTATRNENSDDTAQGATGRTRRLPRFAVDAANGQLRKLGATFTGAADAIDDIAGSAAQTLPGDLGGLAQRAAQKIRGLGEATTSRDAEELFGDVQREAARRPGLTVALGAGLGAALGFLLVRTAPRAAAA